MPLRDAGLFICEHYVSICKEANIYVIIRKQLSGSKRHDVTYIYQTYIYILIFFFHGTNTRYASEELRKDREVVMAAVQKNDVALEYASKDLRNDKDIVMVAVRQNGNSLRYASNEMKNDKNVVLMAVAQNCYGLLYASEMLQCDEDVIRIAMEKNKYILEDLGLVVPGVM